MDTTLDRKSKKMIEDVFSAYQTYDPEKIAKELKVKIGFAKLPNHILILTMRREEYMFAYVEETLEHPYTEFLTAAFIGRYLLSKNKDLFTLSSFAIEKGKFSDDEVAAFQFAFSLLAKFHDKEIQSFIKNYPIDENIKNLFYN